MSHPKLDEIFAAAEAWLHSGTESNEEVYIGQLFGLIDGEHEDQRTAVISKAFTILREIQDEVKANPQELKDLVSVSLQDIKIFNALVNLIVVHGIYPCLSPNVGIPLSLRAKVKDDQFIPVDSTDKKKELLGVIVSSIIEILETPGDARDLFLLGPYSIDFICASAEFAFGPNKSPGAIDKYELIKSQMDTYSLFGYYTTLMRPRGAPQWFVALISRQLTLLPLARTSDGVKSLIEFITGLKDKEEVSLDDLDKAVTVLGTVPRGIDASVYAKNVGRQLLKILGSASRSSESIKSSTVHIVNALHERNTSVIDEGLVALITQFLAQPENEISEEDFANALNTTISMTKTPGPIINTLAPKLLVPLWSLFCYLNSSKRPSSAVSSLIQSLVKVGSQDADPISKNLLVDGIGQFNFCGGPNGGVQLEFAKPEVKFGGGEMDTDVFQIVDDRVGLFMKLISSFEDSEVSKLFVKIMRRWLSAAHETNTDNPIAVFVDLKILDRISQEQKEKLAKSPEEIISVLSSIITDYVIKLQDKVEKKRPTDSAQTSSFSNIISDGDMDSDDEDEAADSDDEEEENMDDEVISVCISLISGLAMEIEAVTGKDRELLETLKPELEYISQHSAEDLRTKASNSLNALKNTNFSTENNTIEPSVKVLTDALRSLEDPLVPIRAHGLHQLRQLIEDEDDVIDPTAIRQTLVRQLKDEDSFIYLSSIKALASLSDKFGADKVVPQLLSIYSSTATEIDLRLRVGEVLHHIILRMDKMFLGRLANSIAQSLVHMVSKRGAASTFTEKDTRIRMSAMSILGIICEHNPQGLSQSNLLDVIDSALGILTFETSSELAVMRRSAVMLVGSLVKGFDSLNLFPKENVKTVKTRLMNAEELDTDSLVRHQASEVLALIDSKIN